MSFNVGGFAAMLALPMTLVCHLLEPKASKFTHEQQYPRKWLLLTPFYLCLCLFSVQPHKEERFMYMAYPFLCLNVASTIHSTERLMIYFLKFVSVRHQLFDAPTGDFMTFFFFQSVQGFFVSLKL